MLRKISDFLRRLIRGSKPEQARRNLPHPLHEGLSVTITNVQEDAKAAYEINQDIGQDLQSVIDSASNLKPLVNQIPAEHLEGMITLWSSVWDQTISIRDGLQEVQYDSDALGGTVSLTSVRATGIFSPDRFVIDDPETQRSLDRFYSYTRRPELREEVRSLLLEFGFDKPQHPGDKSPLDLFDMAHDAFAKPIMSGNPSTTSLIPLRECIQAVIDELIARRPSQEPAGNQKAKIQSKP